MNSVVVGRDSTARQVVRRQWLPSLSITEGKGIFSPEMRGGVLLEAKGRVGPRLTEIRVVWRKHFVKMWVGETENS